MLRLRSPAIVCEPRSAGQRGRIGGFASRICYRGSGRQSTEDATGTIRRIGHPSPWLEDPAEVHLSNEPRMDGQRENVDVRQVPMKGRRHAAIMRQIKAQGGGMVTRGAANCY